MLHSCVGQATGQDTGHHTAQHVQQQDVLMAFQPMKDKAEAHMEANAFIEADVRAHVKSKQAVQHERVAAKRKLWH